MAKQCSYGPCTKESKWRFSPDIDIDGLQACDDHMEIVRMAYAVLMLQQDEQLCYKILRIKQRGKTNA